MPSLSTCLTLNSLIYLLGYVNYTIYQLHPLYALPVYALKNIYLPRIIDCNRTALRPSIYYLTQSVLIDFATVHILCSLASKSSTIVEFLYFVPLSFIYELVFDFFHYGTHRIMHTVPFLYKNIHKHHHQCKNISVYTTFRQSPWDLLFTNILPLYIASSIIPTSPLFIHTYMYFKSLVEIGGHIGTHSKTPCFPQFVWLPLWLRISLFSQDHMLHHLSPHKNFSKRFSIWDKLFGTYSDIKIVRKSEADAESVTGVETIPSFTGI